LTVSTRRLLEVPGSLCLLDLVETGMNHADPRAAAQTKPLTVVTETGERTTMSRYVKLGAIGLLAFVVFAGTTGESSAGFNVFSGTITINDLTDTLTVTPGSSIPPLPPITVVSNSGELLHFTLSNLDFHFPSSTHYADLFEDTVGGILSDRLLVTVTASLIDVQFASDPATLAIPAGAVNDRNLVENGQSQLLIELLATPFSMCVDCTDLQFLVASDPGSDGRDVPEPATLLLLGSGLVWLAGAAWRRQRRA
jgi:PEP-CTERM motif